MKKLRILITIAAISLAMTACHRSSTIIENSNNYHLKIEYSGPVHFNVEGTGISSISRFGYLKYECNEQKLDARNDGHGGIRFELSDHGDPIPSGDQKAFIAKAVKTMLQKNHHPDWY